MSAIRSPRLVLLALLVTLGLNAPLPLLADDSGEAREAEAVEDAVEKEKQKEATGDDKDDVGETEFSSQDCTELNKKKDAGGEVSQKSLDECENENAE